MGIVIGAFAVSSLLMRPFAGRLTDRRGRRIALLLGATISIVAAAGHLVAATIELLIVMRLGSGAGEALFFVAGLAAATDLAPDHRRGEAISLVSLSLYLGIAIGPLSGEVVLDGWGYAAVWIVTATLYAVSVGSAGSCPRRFRRVRRSPRNRWHTVSGKRRKHPLIHPRGIVPGLLALCGVWGWARSLPSSR